MFFQDLPILTIFSSMRSSKVFLDLESTGMPLASIPSAHFSWMAFLLSGSLLAASNSANSLASAPRRSSNSSPFLARNAFRS